MNKMFKGSQFWVPICLFASVLITGCGNKETTTEETTTTIKTDSVPMTKAEEPLPPLDTTAVQKPEDKLNGPSR